MSVSTHSLPSQSQAEVPFSQPQVYNESPGTANSHDVSSLKRKRGDFVLNVERSVDVVAKGLISLADAEVYFRTFFQGCVSCFLLLTIDQVKMELTLKRINTSLSSIRCMTHLRA